jgi:hypothetical protein
MRNVHLYEVRMRHVICIVAVCTVLTACASVSNRVGRTAVDLYQIPPVAERKTAQAGPPRTKRGTSTPIDLDKFRFLETDAETAYVAAVEDKSKDGSMRDRLRAALVAHSERVCAEVQAQIVGTNDLLNFSLGELTTVLAGAGALVTGSTAAKLLSGSAAVTNATRSNVNEVFYQNALKTAIIRRMNELRAAQLKVLYAPEKAGLPVTKYSTEEMILDLERYHNLCSFYAGMTGLTDEDSTITPKAVRAFLDEVNDIVATTRPKSTAGSTATPPSDAAPPPPGNAPVPPGDTTPPGDATPSPGETTTPDATPPAGEGAEPPR